MKALLIGATGATGKELLELLLNDDRTEYIDVFVRKNINIQHNKLCVHIIDFNHPENWKHLVKGDVLYSCLGTTLKDAGSKEAQKKVDYEYQHEFAKAAKENKVESYVLVSADFASAKSPFFYSKIKGQLEEDVKALEFPKLIIFNPPILIRKESNRKFEVMVVKILKFFNTFGLLKSSKPLPTELLAKALLNAFNTLSKGTYSIKGKEILTFASLINNKSN